ncbi:MAG TPA: hypothetical protein VNQ90_15700 [Chthoniobacteraceae bacterium]|nr:hypothetical protein [Chthoniobacteraceae bacterium]
MLPSFLSRRWLLIVPLFMLSSLSVPADPVGDAIAKADRQPAREALATLLEAGKGTPPRADLLAEISLSWSDCADLESDAGKKAEAKKAAEKAVAIADQAVSLDDRNARAHLAVAVAAGKMTDFVGNSAKMKLSRKIHDEAQRTIALDPKQYLAYEILGRWEYGFATLNPVLRMAAKVAFGEIPDASLEKAAGYLEKATALAPGKISPHHQLALVYKALGNAPKARAAWQKVAALPAEDAEDEAAKKEAAAALRR